MYKYVQKQKGSAGQTVYYFRRSKTDPRIRLPSDPHSNEFREAYLAAFKGENVLSPPTERDRLSEASRKKARAEACFAWNRAKRRALLRGKDFDLTLDWVVYEMERTGYLCPLTGIKFDTSYKTVGRMRPFSPSIDRLDNSMGYLKSNCRIIISAMNVMLNDWGEDVFRIVSAGYNRQRKGTLSKQTNPSHDPAAPRTKNNFLNTIVYEGK